MKRGVARLIFHLIHPLIPHQDCFTSRRPLRAVDARSVAMRKSAGLGLGKDLCCRRG